MEIVKYKKKSKDKYELLLDDGNKLEVYEDVILKNELLTKKIINNKVLETITKDNNKADIYNKCIKQISIRMRSEKELREYLKRNQYESQLINDTIDKLKSIKMINDELFAKSLINDKILMTNHGPYKIKGELIKHNIAEEIIDKYLTELNENIFNEKAKKIIDKAVKTNRKNSKNMLINKISNSLNMLGYDRKIYIEYLNQISINNEDFLEKELDKIYKALSGKYKDKELKLKIKQKLYQKGFNSYEIDILIDKKIQ